MTASVPVPIKNCATAYGVKVGVDDALVRFADPVEEVSDLARPATLQRHDCVEGGRRDDRASAGAGGVPILGYAVQQRPQTIAHHAGSCHADRDRANPGRRVACV